MRSQTEPEGESPTPLATVIGWLGAAVHRRRRGALPSLATVHPGMPLGGRWIGLAAVPTECIRGTTSLSIPASRGIDFRPRAGSEPADWPTRWSRLEAAVRDQVILPPVELVRVGGEYWVVDGHNRVALAKEHGQLWIDADVTELDIPEPDTMEPGLGRDKPAAKAA